MSWTGRAGKSLLQSTGAKAQQKAEQPWETAQRKGRADTVYYVMTLHRRRTNTEHKNLGALWAEEKLWLKQQHSWLYHIIPALLVSNLTTLPLFEPSFHLPAAFKTCQLTFQAAGWTSWCLCGGLPSGLCVALSADRHTGSSLSANTFLSLAVLTACVRLMFLHFTFLLSQQWPDGNGQDFYGKQVVLAL